MTINLKAPELRELKPRIMVCGVGGAGGNAVNNMIVSGLVGVDFIVANTDAQALASSRAERIIQMGLQVTEGLGAGSKPEVGRAAAEEAIEEIRDHLAGAHMVFVTAGMGGGTGTGAAPVIARVAREMGILTVGVVTKPFQFEGGRRMRLAEGGITELQKSVDTLIIIPNQNLFRVANEKTTFADAFAMADQVLYSGVACITDLMVKEGLINLDFADVRSIMSEMGKAMMGTGEASGERRAVLAAEAAIANPLLDEVSMKGARGLLISITGGNDLTLYEVDEAASRIRQEVDEEANIILGATFDQSLDGVVRVSVVATGIDQDDAARFTSRPRASCASSKPSSACARRRRARSQAPAADRDRSAEAPPAPRRAWPRPSLSDEVEIRPAAPKTAVYAEPPAPRVEEPARAGLHPAGARTAGRPRRRACRRSRICRRSCSSRCACIAANSRPPPFRSRRGVARCWKSSPRSASAATTSRRRPPAPPPRAIAPSLPAPAPQPRPAQTGLHAEYGRPQPRVAAAARRPRDRSIRTAGWRRGRPHEQYARPAAPTGPPVYALVMGGPPSRQKEKFEDADIGRQPARMQRIGIGEIGIAAEQPVDHRRDEAAFQQVRRLRLFQRQGGKQGQVDAAVGAGARVERVGNVVGLAEPERQPDHEAGSDIADDILRNRLGVGEQFRHQGLARKQRETNVRNRTPTTGSYS